MESFIVSMNAVFPILILTSLGYFIRARKIVAEHVFGEINKLCFRIFLPTLLFYNIYTTKDELQIPWKLMGFTLAMILIIFGLLTVLVPIFVKEPKRQGTMIQGIFRSNFIILGLPIAQAICGGEDIAIISIMAAIVVPTFNLLAVITLTEHGDNEASPRKMVSAVFHNPLIIFSVLGVIFYFLQISMPTFLLSSIKNVASIATPLAIIVLGGSLDFSTFVSNQKPLFVAVFFKLIIVPIIVVGIAIFLGFRNVELVAVLTIFATPTAIASFIMAQQMNCDGELAGGIVILSSAFSGITVFLFVFVLDLLALI